MATTLRTLVWRVSTVLDGQALVLFACMHGHDASVVKTDQKHPAVCSEEGEEGGGVDWNALIASPDILMMRGPESLSANDEDNFDLG